MRVAILGGPGSGKGTQAKMLSERYRVPQISTGDLLREALQSGRGLSEEAKQAMAEGRLVDDDVVRKLLEERLRKRDTKRGFIIDGYPRNIPQAQALDLLLGMLGKILQIAINIDVDDQVLVKRIVSRVSCGKCGAIYSKRFSPPQVKNKCDQCGGALSSRADDTTKTARVRIGVYHEKTTPLIAYYRAQHKLRTLLGEGEIAEIYRKLCDLVDLEIRPLEVKTLEIAADTHDEIETTFIAGGQINRVDAETLSKKSAAKKKKIIVTATKTVGKKKKPLAKKKVAKKTAQKKKVISKSAKKITKKVAKKKAVSKKKPLAKKKVTKKTTQKKKAVSKSAKATKKKVASKKITKKVAKKEAVSKKTGARSAVKKQTPKVVKKIAKKKTTPKKKAARRATKKSTQKAVAGKKR